MRKNYLLLLLALIAIAFKVGAQNEILISPEEYGRLKQANQLKKGERYVITPVPDLSGPYHPKPEAIPQGTARVMDGACQCLVPLNNDFSIVQMSGFPATPPEYRNDDGSSPLIPLNFTFCFYGTNYDACYINNNGNITFVNAQSSFSSTGFPNNDDIMIAPFWADVDTRNASSGLVYMMQGPNYMIVKWDSVGYYSSQADKKNNFQLIISDGTDSLIAGDKNVAFCYGDMQWTTGSASSGVNGFGGIAATAGVNKGDGSNFIQIGRFDHAGTNYDGPYGTIDGISWLDNQSFYFDACGSAGNLPPLSLTVLSGECSADTLKLCSYQDTLILEAVFTAPEQNQNITFTSSAPTLGTHWQQFSSSGTAGTDTVRFVIYGDVSLIGTHMVSITATDNGTPNLSTTLNYIIEVTSVSLPQPVVSATPPPVCEGTGGVTLTLANCTDYTNILWSDGSTGCSATYQQTGTEFVTVTAPAGCSRSSIRNVVIEPNPIPTITGPINYCGAAGTTLNVSVTGSTSPINTYSWNVPGSGNQASVFVDSAYAVIVTVTDDNGCIGDDTVNVTNAAPAVSISSNYLAYCPGQQLVLTASIPGATSYTWSGPHGPYAGTQTITDIPTTGPHSYTVVVNVNGCNATGTITIPQTGAPAVIITVPEYCVGETPSMMANVSPAGDYTYTWQPGAINSPTITPTPGQTYTVTASFSGSCPNTATATAHAGPNPLPSAVIDSYSPGNSLANDTIICNKQNKVLTANYNLVGVDTTGYSYSWNVSGSQQDSCAVVVNTAGTYYLTVVDDNGCVNKDTIEIDMVTPTVQLTYPPLICREDTALVVITGNSTTPFTIEIKSGVNVIGTNDSILITKNGLYPVTIKDENGCTGTANISINYFPKPVANFYDVPDSVSEMGIPVLYANTSTISGGTITGYSWYFGDGSTATGLGPQIHDYAAPGTYPVTLIIQSNKGCFDTVTYNHYVEVHLPLVNIITPNGDAINNRLEFKNLHFFSENKIAIYNRWGKKIYEKDNYDNSWNGDGHEAGTYYYILEVKGHRPESTLTSFFQIIK